MRLAAGFPRFGSVRHETSQHCRELSAAAGRLKQHSSKLQSPLNREMLAAYKESVELEQAKVVVLSSERVVALRVNGFVL